MPATLEGRVVRLADKIAYIHHDIDDAIRAGLMKECDIPSQYRNVLGDTTKERLDTLIHDVIENSLERDDIRMSADCEAAMKGIRSYMYKNLYTNPTAKGEERKTKELLEWLFAYYMDHTDLLPAYLVAMLDKGEAKDRVVCDYIAGMSDQFAIATFEALFVPKAWSY